MSSDPVIAWIKRPGKPIEIGDRLILNGEQVSCEGRSPFYSDNWAGKWTLTLETKDGRTWCQALTVGEINAAKYAFVKGGKS